MIIWLSFFLETDEPIDCQSVINSTLNDSSITLVRVSDPFVGLKFNNKKGKIYSIVDNLGKGAFGQVYSVKDELNKQLYFKVL